MGYMRRDGRWANTRSLLLPPLSAVSTTVYSAVVEVGDRSVARLNLVATAMGGGITCVVTIETSADGITFYQSGSAFTTVAATVDSTWNQRGLYMLDRFVRAKYVPSGGTAVLSAVGEAA